ncbi:scavenger receptor class F member 2-like [Frankliniella occidentalis]|uniref:Scavenger receptor class F member 2-like n=1 Tax=Frankliniella occidentalis TaxID=133901 RepID=A0A9C6XE70_FRAOC|nr:scavenger receptor class F member 2-like [Frankliniella occidentalis]
MRLGSLVLGAALASCAGAFIVPDQLVSLLTVVYSVIPPIKKGSDSRVGFGYRFGPFADFQVLLELGPQSETQPIGGQTTPSSKRQVEPSDEDPGRRPDIQLLDGPEQVLDVPDPAPPSNSRSARSGPAGVVPGANRAPPPPPPAGTDWLSRWRSGLGLPAPAAPAPAPAAARAYVDPFSRPQTHTRTARQPAGFGYGYQPQRRTAPTETRWEAMRRLRSLYWAGQQG